MEGPQAGPGGPGTDFTGTETPETMSASNSVTGHETRPTRNQSLNRVLPGGTLARRELEMTLQDERQAFENRALATNLQYQRRERAHEQSRVSLDKIREEIQLKKQDSEEELDRKKRDFDVWVESERQDLEAWKREQKALARNELEMERQKKTDEIQQLNEVLQTKNAMLQSLQQSIAELQTRESMTPNEVRNVAPREIEDSVVLSEETTCKTLFPGTETTKHGKQGRTSR